MYEGVQPENRAVARRVLEAVRSEFEIGWEQLLSNSRSRPICDARNAAAVVLRDRHKLSFAEIASIFGRDLSSARFGCLTARKRMERDEAMRAAIRRIEAAAVSQAGCERGAA